MELITRWVNARETLARWLRLYPPDKTTAHWRKIGEQIKELGENPHPDTMDSLIGNDTWTRVPDCDLCGTGGHDQVMLLNSVENEYTTERFYVHACGSCLLKALEILEES